ncbi:MAG: phosphoglucosamine mutase [Gammaproteobacteria bacterium]|nr:phosphoglucosamine mutase [Gammaproteobacteria bacterium]
MARKYFGTDGIRGKVGEAPITPEFVLKLGWAIGHVLANDSSSHVLIGKDTRISGYMLESALEAGLSAAGMHIRLLGPMPTPAIAYLTRTFQARAGIVVSASHNPFEDNGIKLFSHAGVKLPDEVELAIEAELEKPMRTVKSAQLGRAKRINDAPGRYIEFCKGTIPPSLLNLKELTLVVDCAHGAAYHIAPNVFAELGANVVSIRAAPDGLNINDACGSTHPEALQAAVIAHQADAGIALDGDGDRVLMVDHTGTVADGDELLYIIAAARHRAGELKGDVVGTVMSNLGLEHALRELGIGFRRAAVGDRYVMEMLRQNGGSLGGESSGHILCLDRTTTGDGIITALQVLITCIQTGQSLNSLKSGMKKYPQRLLNVPVKEQKGILELPAVQAAVRDAENLLADKGRVLLRPSGTEPVIRVMVEGSDAEQVDAAVNDLASVVREVSEA